MNVRVWVHTILLMTTVDYDWSCACVCLYDNRRCLYYLLFIFQRTSEQSKARRKRRRAIKRYKSKKIFSEVPPIATDVPPTATDVLHKREDQPSNEKYSTRHDQLLRYQMFKEKYMGKVDKMLLDSMKKKSLERIKASEEYTDSDDSDYEGSNIINVNPAQDCIDKLEINNAYSKLVENSWFEMKAKCSPSLLLPAVIEPSENVTGTVHIKNNNETEQMPVKVYVERLVNERDTAVKTIRSLRNKVEDLQSKNRKLYCEMNDKIDIIRNFWRNRLVEGDSRSGMCVKLAVRKNLRNKSTHS